MNNLKTALLLAGLALNGCAALLLPADRRAPVMLWRAQADAELSLNLTREAQLHAEALKAEADVTNVNAQPSP